MRFAPLPLIAGCFISLFLLCFFPVLFQDRQFGFRDAGHFYYPLHERVQKEWNEGRWPLWELEENAGTPLLGNPAAAVLYPGKLVFAAFPYAWAARIYIVMHTALAFVAMLVLLRSWAISPSGAAMARWPTPSALRSCSSTATWSIWLVRRGCRWECTRLTAGCASAAGGLSASWRRCWRCKCLEATRRLHTCLVLRQPATHRVWRGAGPAQARPWRLRKGIL